MYHRERLFLFEAGNLALDLVNTARVQDGEAVDDLCAPGDLLAWLDGTGLLRPPGWADPLRAPPLARTLLLEAQRLRTDAGCLLEAHRSGEAVAPHVLYGINRVLEASRASACLRIESGDAWLVESEVGEGPLAVLAPIARAAAELVIDTDPARIRRCASERCGRWFVDTSRGGRRKWCSMATCGNRAKAARHRRGMGTE